MSIYDHEIFDILSRINVSILIVNFSYESFLYAKIFENMLSAV